MEQKKLYKSGIDKKFDGVCGGIAEYFNIDSTLVRLAFVFLALVAGTAIVAYIACMIVVPVNPEHINGGYKNVNNNTTNNVNDNVVDNQYYNDDNNQ